MLKNITLSLLFLTISSVVSAEVVMQYDMNSHKMVEVDVSESKLFRHNGHSHAKTVYDGHTHESEDPHYDLDRNYSNLTVDDLKNSDPSCLKQAVETLSIFNEFLDIEKNNSEQVIEALSSSDYWLSLSDTNKKEVATLMLKANKSEESSKKIKSVIANYYLTECSE